MGEQKANFFLFDKTALPRFPRVCLSEICGPPSSGRTSLALAALASAIAAGEFCAYVDAHDVFDPASAEAAGVDLSQLLWVRCGGNVEHALRCADLLVQAGGFGMIVLDLAEARPEIVRRIPLSVWFRFRLALKGAPTVLAVLHQQPAAKSTAALVLEMRHDSAAPRVLRALRVPA